jgi:CRISPR-associated protein Csm1
MSIQIFLQGKFLGIEEFLLAPAERNSGQTFLGRSHWASLLAEVIPRALLSELGLARILLGSSGGGQFLLVLPEEIREAAEKFLSAAADEIAEMSATHVKLIWSITENLGDWSDIRKRLHEDLDSKRGAPASAMGNTLFETELSAPEGTEDYFENYLGEKLRDAEAAGWSPEHPGRILIGEGKYSWPLAGTADPIPFARHAAPNDDIHQPASTAVLASRATGLSTWGVLRGDVDNYDIRLRRAQNIEEHIQLSVMFKQFFAGELEVLCSMPEFWRKVTVIYSGGDDFALLGAWDALLALAAEMERLFHRFVGSTLKDFAGPEGKTISMALALAPAVDASLGAVFEEAGQRLEAAKSADKDCIWLLGRTLEWKEFAEASTLRESLMRMISEFECSPQYLKDLCGIYRETQSRVSRRQARKTGGERPWRYHRRITRILSASRETGPKRNEFQKARTALIADLIGRSAITVKLRPAGRVALEWARLSAEA